MVQPEHPHTTEIRQRVRALESTSSGNKTTIAQRFDWNLAEETGQLRQEEGALQRVCDAMRTRRHASVVPGSRSTLSYR